MSNLPRYSYHQADMGLWSICESDAFTGQPREIAWSTSIVFARFLAQAANWYVKFVYTLGHPVRLFNTMGRSN